MTTRTTSLRATQEWLAAAIMHAGELPPDFASAIDTTLTRGPRMSARARLDVYRHAYQARLIECLADDYPALQHALGAAFDDVARDYIARHPSDAWSLNVFGRHMASFCRTRPEPWAGFAADLASLEWAIVDVIHAADAAPLALEALASIPAEAWPAARFTPSPAVRVLRFDYPVNAYFQAFRDDGDPRMPEACASAVAVYRDGAKVWRMDLTPPMASLLGDLFAGRSLGDALGALDTHALDEDATRELEANVMAWFRAWVSGGLFASVIAA